MLYEYEQDVIEGVFEIVNRFWSHKNLEKWSKIKSLISLKLIVIIKSPINVPLKCIKNCKPTF